MTVSNMVQQQRCMLPHRRAVAPKRPSLVVRGSTTNGAAGPPPAWPGYVPVPPMPATAEVRQPQHQPRHPRHTGFTPQKKKFSVIGSTGSIGTQTLDIVAEHPERFEVVALASGGNLQLLAEQIRAFPTVNLVSIRDADKIAELQELIADVPNKPEIVAGSDGICEVAAHPDAQSVVTGIVGCAGLYPTVAAIKAGKDICLANKETLIAGGPYVLPLAKEHGVHILPADSEHSAIFQCLQGLPPGGMRRIILTASGGAFRDWPVERLQTAKVADALKHPNWDMGKKITIDSATLMNKGLEVIEAHYLFGADYDNIEIVIHPQSIIHSMVETQDSSVLAQVLLLLQCCCYCYLMHVVQ